HENGCASDDSKIDEGCAAMLALRNFTTLGFRGGILRQNGAIVSYTIGEPIGNDTFAIHFEKAFSTIQGAYPVINQLFVQAEAMDFRYINREEDAGSEGLRKAKLSYYPAFLLEKYTAEMI
ncbi:MAG: phosphatidylglycerol lysyltransferase domain-containing protein, partial [Oscillospiraceae bacterium]